MTGAAPPDASGRGRRRGGAEAPGERRRRPLRHWLGLALVALGGSLLAAELTLQLAGLVVRGLATRDVAPAAGGEVITILCVGDSHTYGLPLPEEDSYPAQLERALAARFPGHAFQVVNLGVPGLNSSFVANRLERQIFQLQPRLVIVWVGINNLWNVVETLQWERPDHWRWLRQSLQAFKLFRLASIGWFSLTGHQYDPEQRGGWYEGEQQPSGRLPRGADMPDPAPGLARDLTRMTELTRALDLPILFVTYPMQAQDGINAVIARTGARLGVEVIDSQAALRRAFADGYTSEELVDRRTGPHPGRVLYAYTVEAMLPRVVEAIEAWHGIDLAGAARPPDPAPAAVADSPARPRP